MPPAEEAQSPTHGATREFLESLFLAGHVLISPDRGFHSLATPTHTHIFTQTFAHQRLLLLRWLSQHNRFGLAVGSREVERSEPVLRLRPCLACLLPSGQTAKGRPQGSIRSSGTVVLPTAKQGQRVSWTLNCQPFPLGCELGRDRAEE